MYCRVGDEIDLFNRKHIFFWLRRFTLNFLTRMIYFTFQNASVSHSQITPATLPRHSAKKHHNPVQSYGTTPRTKITTLNKKPNSTLPTHPPQAEKSSVGKKKVDAVKTHPIPVLPKEGTHKRSKKMMRKPHGISRFEVRESRVDKRLDILSFFCCCCS